MDVNPELRNLDKAVVRGFGDEWSRFDQSTLSAADRDRIWQDYFALFPWEALPSDAVGMDVGCGSGRWAQLVAPRVRRLLCIDASTEALNVARRNLAGHENVEFREASVEALPVADGSLDFIYSLGVLHHVPDTAEAVRSVAAKLKPGAPILLYLYYDFENRAGWFRALWRASELVRRILSHSPHGLSYAMSNVLAAVVYWPLARLAQLADRAGACVDSWPLAYYRDKGLYVMRTDARDRFGTQLEQRFSRADITTMLVAAGCEAPVFSDQPPYWVAVARKS
ncbi:3-demethylubiquinone-9 3-methyltransferase [Rhodopseudomonas palustris]|uniref:class I SAM-dependent methyltransferase n=1 Tax=Rhodopseudomonas palustris TaxID=1076 RepID=UPI000D19B424|nr:class I SAM-dependent methyltransferase [Rhodopseudomonas palustris]AVT78123.1 3-demethylubiquinone-9 3-methyltransferase [Rhodopseudomonas palustris]